MATMKVKPWGKEQGDFVIIDEENFDEKVHQKFTAAELKKLEAAADEPEKADEVASDEGAE